LKEPFSPNRNKKRREPLCPTQVDDARLALAFHHHHPRSRGCQTDNLSGDMLSLLLLLLLMLVWIATGCRCRHHQSCSRCRFEEQRLAMMG
jgi:hypothetical protein